MCKGHNQSNKNTFRDAGVQATDEDLSREVEAPEVARDLYRSRRQQSAPVLSAECANGPRLAGSLFSSPIAN